MNHQASLSSPAPAPEASPTSRFAGVSRWRASAIHLGISAAVGLAVLALLLLVWFPGVYFEIMGASHLILVMLGVDIVLGPLITLIIFNPKKKSLPFDLAVIALLQVSALAYGMYTMALARPAFVLFAVDRFDVSSAAEIEPAQLALGRQPQFRTLSWTGPVVAAAKSPEDREERKQLLFSSLAGVDLKNLPKYFVPYGDLQAQALKRSLPLDKLRQRAADNGPAIDGFLADHRRAEDTVRWLPMTGKRGDAAVMLDARTGAVLGMIRAVAW
jgi:hypothetical protein